MARERRDRPARRMKPLFVVFCEGETESNYAEALGKHFRLPVHAKIFGSGVSRRAVQEFLKRLSIGPSDNLLSYFLYDLDVPGVVDRIRECEGILLGSDPCIEVWFLLHFADVRAPMDSSECVRRLREVGSDWTSYMKGRLTDVQRESLLSSIDVACTRARCLPASSPSSGVYRFLDDLQKASKNEPRL